MKEGWESKALGEVCELVKRGIAPKYTEEGGILVINQKCIRDHKIDLAFARRHDIGKKNVPLERYIQLGDVLVNSTGTGTLGRVAQLRNDISNVTVDTHVTIVRPKEGKFYLDFFGYAMTLIEEEIKKAGEGTSGQTELSRAKLSKNFIITYPTSLPEQQQIVSILDRAFAAIDQAKANLERNIENAKELLQSKLNEIFSRQGEGWEERRLGDVCHKIQDGAHHSPKKLYQTKEDHLYPYITSKNIRTNYMDLSNVQYVDESFHNTIYPRCNPELGDVLITKDGANTGNITLNTLDEPFSLLSSVCLIKPNRDELSPKYLKYYIQSPLGFKSITGKMTGAAIKRIILKTIKAATIPLPDVKTQDSIIGILDMLRSSSEHTISSYQKKLTSLEELKKSILQQAFSGELTKDFQLSASGFAGLEDEQDLGIAAEPKESYGEKGVTRN